MSQTLIWSNTNDSHNEAVIIREIEDLKQFVPKVAVKVQVIDNTENIEDTVNKIIASDIENNTILTFITNQHIVITYLISKFKPQDSNKICWKEYKPYMQWLLDTSIVICKKFNLHIEYFTDNANVQRSSYKFCTNGAKCVPVYKDIMNYNNRSCACIGDHFVHNKIVRDLTNLFSVLDVDESKLYQDLRLGLNTLNFVLGHVKAEMSTFAYHLAKSDPKFNIDQFYKTSIENSTKMSNKPNKYNRKK